MATAMVGRGRRLPGGVVPAGCGFKFAIARDNQEHGLTIESLCLKAKIECMSDNYQLALDLFNTALSLSSKIGEVNLEIDTYAVMYKSFKEKENYTDIAQRSLERGVSLAEQIKNDRQRAMFFES